MANDATLSPAEREQASLRLSVLKLAEKLGNVSEACRRRGIGRSRFYEWKHRFRKYGLAGLLDRPPVHKGHPMTKASFVVSQILELSMEHPAWGCMHLSKELKLIGVSVSSTVIHRILTSHGLGRHDERVRLLEERALDSSIDLSVEQTQAIEKINPCYRERRLERQAPGELLCHDIVELGRIKNLGTVYMQAVVDTFSCYAFGLLHCGEMVDTHQMEFYHYQLVLYEVLVLKRIVLPTYKSWDIPVRTIVTSTKRAFCRKNHYAYKSYLAEHFIEHQTPNTLDQRMNGFLESFTDVVRHEFFGGIARHRCYKSLKGLQTAFNKWLESYNWERVQPGYPNRGESPVDVLRKYVELSHK